MFLCSCSGGAAGKNAVNSTSRLQEHNGLIQPSKL